MWPSTDRLFGYEQIRHLYWSTNVFIFFVFSSQHGTVTTLQIIASKKSLRTIVAVRTFLSPKPLNSRQCVRAHRQDCRRGGCVHKCTQKYPSTNTERPCTFPPLLTAFFSPALNWKCACDPRKWFRSVNKTEPDLWCDCLCCHPFTCQAVITCVFNTTGVLSISSLILF